MQQHRRQIRHGIIHPPVGSIINQLILQVELSKKMQKMRTRPMQKCQIQTCRMQKYQIDSSQWLSIFGCALTTDLVTIAQGGTLNRVALELRGTQTTVIDREAIPSQCDPYSPHVRLSRFSCRNLPLGYRRCHALFMAGVNPLELWLNPSTDIQ